MTRNTSRARCCGAASVRRLSSPMCRRSAARPSLDPLPEEDARRPQRLFGRAGGRGTGLRLRGRIDAIADQWDDGGKELRAVHDVGNAMSNAELHSSSYSMARALRRIPDGQEHERLLVFSGAEP